MKPLARDKKKSIWCSKPVIIVEIILLILLTKGVFNVYGKYQRASDTRDNIQKEFDRVSERHNKLEKRVEYLGTDFAQEEAMRERFDVLLPGEEVIKLVDREVEVENDVEVEEKGFWSRLISVFGF